MASQIPRTDGSGRIPSQRLDGVEERPYRVGRILPCPKLDAPGLGGHNLDSRSAAVDRFWIHPLRHAHTEDVVGEPLYLINSVGRQPPLCADLAVIGDDELITRDRGDTIIVHHPAEDADGDLHPLRVSSTPAARASRHPPIEDLVDLRLVTSGPAGGK